jgi:uncharacterized damage-inducible protein DinB
MEPIYAALYDRLQGLHAELHKALEGLDPAALDWSPGPEMNSLAILAAHVAGAERFWIGDVVAGDDSGRVRAAEFETRGQDAAALQARLAETLAYSHAVLSGLTTADLGRECNTPDGEYTYTVAWALLHALEHTAEPVGHCQMIRQLWHNRPAAQATTPV